MHARVNTVRLNWVLSHVRVEAVTEQAARAAVGLLKEAGLHGHKCTIDATGPGWRSASRVRWPCSRRTSTTWPSCAGVASDSSHSDPLRSGPSRPAYVFPGQAAIGAQGLTDVTRVPIRTRCVTVAAAVRVGIAPNHGPSRNDRQDRWSYVYAAWNPRSSARRQIFRPSAGRWMGRITVLRRMPPTIRGPPAAGDTSTEPSTAWTPPPWGTGFVRSQDDPDAVRPHPVT